MASKLYKFVFLSTVVVLILSHQSTATFPIVQLIDNLNITYDLTYDCGSNCIPAVTICAAGSWMFFDRSLFISAVESAVVYFPNETCFPADALNLTIPDSYHEYDGNFTYGSYRYLGQDVFGAFDTINCIALYPGVSFSSQDPSEIQWMNTTFTGSSLYMSFIIYNIPNANSIVSYVVSDSSDKKVCLHFYDDVHNYNGPQPTDSRVGVYSNVTALLGLNDVADISVNPYPCPALNPNTMEIPSPSNIVTIPAFPIDPYFVENDDQK